jgi:hypothetical protein
MPGLVPGIHVLAAFAAAKDVDGRDKPGHDETWSSPNSTRRSLVSPGDKCAVERAFTDLAAEFLIVAGTGCLQRLALASLEQFDLADAFHL